MARLPRLYLPGCAQHVIQRGNNKRSMGSESLIFTGKSSGWESYIGAAVGGAIAGEVALYAPVTIPAMMAVGAVGGASANITTQSLEVLNPNNPNNPKSAIDKTQLAVATGGGLIAGPIGAKLGGALAPKGTPTIGAAIAQFDQAGTNEAAKQFSKSALGQTLPSKAGAVVANSVEVATGAGGNAVENQLNTIIDNKQRYNTP